MILGIDASNVRLGGGLLHLVEILRISDPSANGFSRVIVWGSESTLAQIEDRPWLAKNRHPWLDKSLPHRLFWQRFRLSKLAKSAGCDLLFVPGGSHSGGFHPMVTMSQNMLPFEWPELRRYGLSLTGLRLMALRWTQSHSFRKAEGLIFLTQYARHKIEPTLRRTSGKTAVIPLGVGDRFTHWPRAQEPISTYSENRPYRILYVSIVDEYKHQWQVARAVSQLRSKGLPLTLELVGPAYPPALARLRGVLSQIDPGGEFVRYTGAIDSGNMQSRYFAAELCLFASTCENMPNILLEGMASGLPIACSNRGPMPEVLGDAGVYFDPEKPDEIAAALGSLIASPELRVRLSKRSYERAQSFKWERCADETFEFLADVAVCSSHISSTQE